MTDHPDTPPLSPEEKARILLERIKTGFDNTPFVKLIGMELTDVSADEVRGRFDMKPELVGNTWKQILHGGVIATALDTVGGAMGFVAVYQFMKQQGCRARSAMRAWPGSAPSTCAWIISRPAAASTSR